MCLRRREVGILQWMSSRKYDAGVVLEVITANVDDDPAYEVVGLLRCNDFWYEKSYDPFVAAFDLTPEGNLCHWPW